MENSEKTFINCPKCGAEVRYINLGGISYEECQNCGGIFLDFSETDNEIVADVLSVSDTIRKDRKALDEITINCPKCKVKMEKKPIAKRKDMSMDSCPECKGAWFDQGEFQAYLNPIAGLVTKQSPFKIWFECEACKIVRNQNEVKERDNGGPLCPRCQKPLKFNSVRLDDSKEFRKDMTAIVVWVSGTILSFILTRIVLINAGYTANLAALGALSITFLGVGLIYMLFKMTNESKKIREESIF